MNVVNLTLTNLEATTSLGAAIASSLRILLVGDLGSGKTTLARAIGAALRAEPALTSPTFILVSEHRGDLPIWHVDAYRLPVGSDPIRAGIIDERQQRGVTLIEWPEHLEGIETADPNVLQIHLTSTDDESSRIAEIRGARPELLTAVNSLMNATGGIGA